MRQNGVRSNVRFPYGKGGSSKMKNKDTKIEKMSLSVLEEEKNLARNNPLKLEETSLTENFGKRPNQKINK